MSLLRDLYSSLHGTTRRFSCLEREVVDFIDTATSRVSLGAQKYVEIVLSRTEDYLCNVLEEYLYNAEDE